MGISLLIGEGPGPWSVLVVLVADGTIAGNLVIPGAAGHVQIIPRFGQEGYSLTFREFALTGIPLTLLQTSIFGSYLVWAFG